VVEETVEQGVEANNDKERDERKFVKAKRRKGSVRRGHPRVLPSGVPYLSPVV
jgi:hypothetical protein